MNSARRSRKARRDYATGTEHSGLPRRRSRRRTLVGPLSVICLPQLSSPPASAHRPRSPRMCRRQQARLTSSGSVNRNWRRHGAQQKSSTELQQQLKATIAAIGEDRSKLNAQLIDVAARVRTVEARIGDAEARLRPLDARDQQIRSSLNSRRAEIVEVLAALQRAGRRTPPAFLVRPEDALQSLRTAILLGAVVPEMRARAKRWQRPRRTVGVRRRLPRSVTAWLRP